MKTYHISRLRDDVNAAVEENGTSRFLQHVKFHNATGFEYGYTGSGPADLALSILVDYFDEKVPAAGWTSEAFSTWTLHSQAWRLHQPFKRAFIAPLPREGGRLYDDVIRAWVAIQEITNQERNS